MKIAVNRNYAGLAKSYLFSEIARRVREFAPSANSRIIRLGIGDVTLPLSPIVCRAMTEASREMGDKSTFRGYAPEYGYDFLRDAVAAHYGEYGAHIERDEIFVSDGAKSDIGNITDLFGDCDIIVPDPVYPVYVDSNAMNGRRIHYINSTADNGFLPSPLEIPTAARDIPAVIYICSPNNPTGAAYDRAGLREWVDYANKTGSLIIYDGAYERFIKKSDIPHSIYEIEGAKSCAIEVNSLSKTAGFTGTRCGWTIVPLELSELNSMWARRQATKFNGVAYVIQRAAEAALSAEGMAECDKNIAYYMENAAAIADVLDKCGIYYTGGVSSPYIWLQCPDNMSSWDFFDLLLKKACVVGTPGAGFGSCGEGFFRLTAFGSHEDTIEAAQRLSDLLKK